MQYQVDRDKTKEPSPVDSIEKTKTCRKMPKVFFLSVENKLDSSLTLWSRVPITKL